MRLVEFVVKQVNMHQEVIDRCFLSDPDAECIDIIDLQPPILAALCECNLAAVGIALIGCGRSLAP